MRGDDDQQPCAVQSGGEWRLCGPGRRRCEETIDEADPQCAAEKPEGDSDILMRGQERDLVPQDIRPGDDRQKGWSPSMIAEIGDHSRREVDQPEKCQNPQRQKPGRVDPQQKRRASSKAQQFGDNRYNAGRHHEGEAAAREIRNKTSHCALIGLVAGRLGWHRASVGADRLRIVIAQSGPAAPKRAYPAVLRHALT